MVAGLISFPPDPTYQLAERVARRAPLYPMVPKDLKENLAFRKRMIEWGCESVENARVLWIACRRDLLFFVNTFCWCQDPRKQNFEALPFITYPFQDGTLLRLDWCIGRCDLWGEKSRDMGFTTMVMTVFGWRVLFYDAQTFKIGSRKEELVDKPGDTDTLFAKWDFTFDRLPPFLIPGEYVRKFKHFSSRDTKSVIDGEASGPDFGRGGRRTATFHDEFASDGRGYEVMAAVGDVTRSRIFCSTPKPSGAFTENVKKQDTLKLTLHWRQHPEKSPGLYTSKSGRLKIIDTAYPFPDDYPFILDGRLRSVAYDAECRRRKNQREMAQEWDIEYIGAGFQFFDPLEINKLLEGPEATVREPYHIGNLEWDLQTFKPTKFVNHSGGLLRLWCKLDERGNPPSFARYVAGGDVAAGTGASNSCLSIVNRQTGEKVGEFISPNLSPEDFAVRAVAICRWFVGVDGQGAYLGWEANGPGMQFGKKVVELGYRNIYFDKPDRKIAPKPTDKPGWYSTDDNKAVVLGAYRESLGDRFVNRSEQALRETLMYNYLPDGSVAHTDSATSPDPSGARDNHGDRVIADAVACLLVGAIAVGEQRTETPSPPGWSFKSRREAYVRSRNQTVAWHNRDRRSSKLAEVA